MKPVQVPDSGKKRCLENYAVMTPVTDHNPIGTGGLGVDGLKDFCVIPLHVSFHVLSVRGGRESTTLPVHVTVFLMSK